MPEITCEHCGSTVYEADNVGTYGMTDQHTFVRYSARSVDELIGLWIDSLWEHPDMGIALCPIQVKCGKSTLREVGPMLHYKYDRDDGKPYDKAAVEVFRKAALADPDISRLMQEVDHD